MSLRRTAATGGVLLAATCLTVLPQTAAGADTTDLVISEVYGGGGNSGATYTHDFVELHNPTAEVVSVDGLSVQYRPAEPGPTTQTQVTPLTGSIPAGGHYLVQLARGNGGTTALPTPDATGTTNMSGTRGQAYLVSGTAAVVPPDGHVGETGGILDFVGFGAITDSFETAPTADLSSGTSAHRAGTDTDDNSADFTVAAPDPRSSGGQGGGVPAGPAELSIAEIQGTGDRTGHDGQDVTTRGVVTAVYPEGGFDGFYLQTPGTGGSAGEASHGIFVDAWWAADRLAVGDHVEVTGEADEFFGMTQIRADEVEELAEPAAPVVPLATTWPATDAERERLEGMLLAPQGTFTVTDNWSVNRFAEIGIAQGDAPLRQPTDVAPHGSAEAQAVAAHNRAARVTLDDGASTDYLGNRGEDVPLPWLTDDPTIRVGESVAFQRPVVLDYRFGLWRFQPTSQLSAGDDNGVLPATFGDTRTTAPRDVGGSLQVATFNVLNYFTTLGDELDGCTFYSDRFGDPVSVRGGCLARGAAEEEDFLRQQAKIVTAINALDAEVVSLEEIENSVQFGADRDQALSALVDALNADAGAGSWAFVPSPQDSTPPPGREDVIRNALIYRPDAVRALGPSVIHDGPEFDNARDPLAQVFMPVGGSAHDRFLLVVNHFKSKGSAPDDRNDPNADHGQGAWNVLRTSQAEALVRFADEVSADKEVEKVYVGGDLNSYLAEDPMQVLYAAGYTSLQREFATTSTYLFGGLVGSLDHWLANDAALGTTTGADVWNINSVESVALEYSRHNYNATSFFDAATPYRSSDHDPIVFGIEVRRNR